jgi:hypothetical protein
MATDLYGRGGAVEIDGLVSTIRTMKALGDSDATIKEALKQAAETMAAASRDTVPDRTGKLKRSIRTSATARGAFVIAGGKAVPYANPIHWGWFRDRKSERARKSPRGYVNKNIKPNPFFAKALGYTRTEIFDNFTKVIEDEVTKTIRRGIGGRRK